MNQKRIRAAALAMVLCMLTTLTAYGTTGKQMETITYRSIGIFVNGTEIVPCDVSGNSTEPFIRNQDESTYLPVRALSGALGLDVDWDDATSTVILKSGGTVHTGEGSPVKHSEDQETELTFRNISITLDGKTIELKSEKGEAVEPFIKDDSTYIPVRAVSSALGCKVSWDDATSSIVVENSSEIDENVKKGDIVTFGNYEQDNIAENGKEPIEWMVLGKNEDQVLLLSRYGLDAKAYYDTNTSITWELSTVRAWLNSEFLEEAFSEEEQSRIPVTTVENPDSYWGYDSEGNSAGNNTGEGITDLRYQVPGGNATKDQVFLLSMDEAKTLLGYDRQTLYKQDGTSYEGYPALQTSATAYAQARGVTVSKDYVTSDGSGTCWWWMRSPGYGSYLAALASSIGDISTRYVSRDYYAVRPVIWVTISKQN